MVAGAVSGPPPGSVFSLAFGHVAISCSVIAEGMSPVKFKFLQFLKGSTICTHAQ